MRWCVRKERQRNELVNEIRTAYYILISSYFLVCLRSRCLSFGHRNRNDLPSRLMTAAVVVAAAVTAAETSA